MPLQALHIMYIVREHHDAAFRIHDVVVKFLAQPIPKLHRMIVKMRAFIIEIIGTDNRCVTPGVAATDPAFFKHGDVGNPIFFGEIICRA